MNVLHMHGIWVLIFALSPFLTEAGPVTDDVRALIQYRATLLRAVGNTDTWSDPSHFSGTRGLETKPGTRIREFDNLIQRGTDGDILQAYKLARFETELKMRFLSVLGERRAAVEFQISESMSPSRTRDALDSQLLQLQTWTTTRNRFQTRAGAFKLLEENVEIAQLGQSLARSAVWETYSIPASEDAQVPLPILIEFQSHALDAKISPIVATLHAHLTADVDIREVRTPNGGQILVIDELRKYFRAAYYLSLVGHIGSYLTQVRSLAAEDYLNLLTGQNGTIPQVIEVLGGKRAPIYTTPCARMSRPTP